MSSAACCKCGKSFSTDSALYRHQREIHEKSEYYECPYCVYTATRSTDINKHSRSMHKDQTDKFFPSKTVKVPGYAAETSSSSRKRKATQPKSTTSKSPKRHSTPKSAKSTSTVSAPDDAIEADFFVPEQVENIKPTSQVSPTSLLGEGDSDNNNTPKYVRPQDVTVLGLNRGQNLDSQVDTATSQDIQDHPLMAANISSVNIPPPLQATTATTESQTILSLIGVPVDAYVQSLLSGTNNEIYRPTIESLPSHPDVPQQGSPPPADAQYVCNTSQVSSSDEAQPLDTSMEHYSNITSPGSNEPDTTQHESSPSPSGHYDNEVESPPPVSPIAPDAVSPSHTVYSVHSSGSESPSTRGAQAVSNVASSQPSSPEGAQDPPPQEHAEENTHQGYHGLVLRLPYDVNAAIQIGEYTAHLHTDGAWNCQVQ